ncbi:long-chain fatty acid--CoA ligase [Dolichospermum heterosporum]|uniref:Long-chain fatty acid--CoA ligase n=1 Tax=Dolichospermum heterosporum TAC447 TaxID=747523 RepID=A0ABY5LMN5_9CYAN|nr:long-chain fatty acid--CoA ligase [Dolichospermum heterosporum]UUO13222.1 long-chain fatty acid--CoA ligase [Dolichospermum heterosporum TAC447]
MNNLERFLSYFADYGEQNALILNHRNYSYNWLLERIKYWYYILSEEGIEKSIVGFRGDYSPEIIALFFALIWLKNILVPLGVINQQEQNRYFDIANIQYLLSIEESETLVIEDLKAVINNQILTDFIKQQSAGIILFSSGSTGTPKGMLHDCEKLLSKYTKGGKSFNTLAFLSLDHIGGINTLLYQLSNGGTTLLANDRRPENICQLIENCQIELLPVSPTFLNLLLMSESYKNYDVSSLKIISYGTEVMPENTLTALANAFPGVRLKQTYGLSELGILPTKSESSDSKWVKLGGEDYEVKIVDNILWIKTNSAMISYLNAPYPFDDQGWLNTGDVVEMKGDYFKILGRQSEMIIVGGLKVFPQEIENILIQMPEIDEVTVFGEPNAITGNIVVAVVKPIDISIDERKMRKLIQSYCQPKLQSYKIPVKVYLNSHEHHNHRYKKIRSQVKEML